MGNPEDWEKIRGVKDDDLPRLSNEQVICLALARSYEAQGIDDDVFIAELYRRGRGDYAINTA